MSLLIPESPSAWQSRFRNIYSVHDETHQARAELQGKVIMTRYSFILPALVLSLATAAHAETEAAIHSESVNSAGTTVTVDKSHENTVGFTGTRTIETESKVVTDPKGLNNKTKEITKIKQTIDKDGDTSREVLTVDAAGTKRESDTTVATSDNWGGGKTVTSTHTEIVDPEGLGNKQTVEVKKEVVTNADGTTESTVKKVDGNVVSQTGDH